MTDRNADLPRRRGAASGDARLRSTLEREFTTAVEEVMLGSKPVELLRPRNADDLISEADFVRDERLPYWADLWPSSRILAERLLDEQIPSDVRPRLLELGCGLGLVTIAALTAGFDVLATDYYADALRFTELNAREATSRAPATRLVDWRHFPDDLGTFDRVVAADVLYEHAYAPLITDAIARTLRPTGVALIADPGRIGASAFRTGLASHGLRLAALDEREFRDGPVRQQIAVYSIVHAQ